MKDNPIPKHYATPEGFDVIDFNKAYDLNFNLGNVIKYVARAGKKDGESKLKDLNKAIDYLNRELNSIPVLTQKQREFLAEKLKRMNYLIYPDVSTDNDTLEGFFELHGEPFSEKEFKKGLNDIEVNEPEEVCCVASKCETKRICSEHDCVKRTKAFDPEELSKRFKEDVKLSEELADILELTYAATPNEMKFSEECEFVVADKYSSVISKNAKYRGIPVRTVSDFAMCVEKQ